MGSDPIFRPSHAAGREPSLRISTPAGASVNTTPYQVHGEVAVITFDNPPMNGFSHALRRAIVAGIESAEDDAGVKAIVLIGSAKVFSSGADIQEFGTQKMMAE